MIQRIQSFYLVLAVCAIALCFMFPVAIFDATGDEGMPHIVSHLYLIPRDNTAEGDVLRQVEMGESMVTIPQRGIAATWPLTVAAALSGVLALVSIFLFKNRMRQVRVVAFAFLLNLVYLFILFIGTVDSFTSQVSQMGVLLQITKGSTTYSVATWAALASLLFLFLAQRAIKRDEAKVRAADRLR